MLPTYSLLKSVPASYGLLSISCTDCSPLPSSWIPPDPKRSSRLSSRVDRSQKEICYHELHHSWLLVGERLGQGCDTPTVTRELSRLKVANLSISAALDGREVVIKFQWLPAGSTGAVQSGTRQQVAGRINSYFIICVCIHYIYFSYCMLHSASFSVCVGGGS